MIYSFHLKRSHLKRPRLTAVILAGQFLFAAPLRAVPHLIPGTVEPGMRTCFVNKEASRERMKAMRRFAPGFAPPISATTRNIALIRVDFSDLAMTKTQAQAETFMNNMKTFFLENSYNLFTINATVSSGGLGDQGSYRMPRSHDFYANALSSNYAALTSDAIAVATTTGLNFASFDHIMIYHAGEGAETATNPNNFIWSVFLPSNLVSGPIASGKTFSGLTIVPEKEFFSVDPLGVICHEYGHQLGLPDLYDTANSQATVVGKWSLMDSGVFIGSPQGSNPAHLDPWSKQFLGFSDPETISFSAGTSKTLSQAETSRTSFLRLPISASNVGEDNEYFLLEYRRTIGATYDTSLPGQGLLIWHIDDSIASNQTRLDQNSINTNVPNLGVSLVEADSTDPSSNSGDSTDPWPGNNTTFQSPQSFANNGKDSGIAVSDITTAGAATIAMTVRTTLSNPAITSNSTQGSVVVTGGAEGYVNPGKGETALIGVLPARSGTVEIKIYSLSGDLVHESTVQGTQGQNTTVSWNGTNKDGDTVSSGIYLIHINGGGIDTKKKTVIVR